MTIPVKTVRVGEYVYRITRDPFDTPDNTQQELDAYAGMTYHDQLVIYVRPHVPEAIEKETVLHELMHCGISRTGNQHQLKQFAKSDDCDDVEELYVATASRGLYDILRQNKKLNAWLWS